MQKRIKTYGKCKKSIKTYGGKALTHTGNVFFESTKIYGNLNAVTYVP